MKPAVRLVTVFALCLTLLVSAGVPVAGAATGVATTAAGGLSTGAGQQITVYYGLSLPRQFVMMPVTTTAPEGMTPERGALQRLIEGPPAGTGLFCSIPKTTRVLGLDMAGDLATVNFSADILQANVGASTEGLLLASIADTLTQFPGIERVAILVEGKPAGSLGGHIEITEPLRRNMTMLHRKPFSDTAGHWAEGYVSAFHLTGIIDGYPEGDFRPEGSVTREEFVKMLVLAASLQPLTAAGLSAQPTFADVPSSRWSSGYIEAAVKAGIVRAADYGATFNPQALLTRREMAALMVRAAGQEALATSLAAKLGPAGATLPYTDLTGLPGWAAGFIAAAAQLHLVKGYPDATFRPAATIKRSEAATVLARLMSMGEGPVFMVQPRAGQTIGGDNVVVMGVASVFEAALSVRVKDAAGNVLSTTGTTATEGGPGWGVYAVLVPAPAAAGSFTVEAFTTSAKDGSEMGLVSRQLTKSVAP